MTDRRSRFMWIAMVVTCSLVIAACGGTAGDPTTTEGETDTPSATDEPATDTTQDASEDPTTTTVGGDDGPASNTIVMIPKQTGDPFFVATNDGAMEAGDELGYEIEFLGPPSADATGQVTAIEQAIQLNPAAITIAANDPDAVAPALQQATDAGILVTSFNADVAEDAREHYVDQADPQAIAETAVQEMIDALGGQTSGQFLMVTSVLTAPNQTLWIELMGEHLAAEYPDMEIAEIVAGNDDQQTVQQVTRTYLQANPDTTGVWVMGGGMPGAVLAMQQMGVDPTEVPVTGLCIPSVVAEFLKEGLINDCSLWNPVDLGYASVYAIDAHFNDQIPYGEEGTISAGRLGDLEFVDDRVILGDPFIFTPDNVDDFDF